MYRAVSQVHSSDSFSDRYSALNMRSTRFTASLGFDGKPIEVMSSENILYVLFAAVGIGVVLMLIALIINIYSCFKQKNVGAANIQRERTGRFPVLRQRYSDRGQPALKTGTSHDPHRDHRLRYPTFVYLDEGTARKAGKRP